MAGSLKHLVNPETGEFNNFANIDHLRDAFEACEECFHIIRYLTGGNMDRINAACRALGYPEISRDLVSGELTDRLALRLQLSLNEVASAAESIEADLSGNADSRIRGRYMMIEEARVRHLLEALKGLRVARAAYSGTIT